MSGAADDITGAPDEAPRPDAERMDHARVLLAGAYGEERASWLALRWCRALVLLGEGDGRDAMSALRRHVESVGDEADVRAFGQIEAALRSRGRSAASVAHPAVGDVVRRVIPVTMARDQGVVDHDEAEVGVRIVRQFHVEMHLVGTPLVGRGRDEVAAGAELGSLVSDFARSVIGDVRSKVPLDEASLRAWKVVAEAFPLDAANAEAERVFGDAFRRGRSGDRAGLQVRVRTVQHSATLWVAGLYGWHGGWTGGIGWVRDKEGRTEREAIMRMFFELRALPDGAP